MEKVNPANILFSPDVRQTQSNLGSADHIKRLESRNHWKSELSLEQQQFIEHRDSFYIATSSSTGRPYIQHRGGSEGFIQIEDASTLWFPDYGGNRQYISIGNLSKNPQAFIFFMDYQIRRRLKIWGQAFMHETADLPVRNTPLHDGSRPQRAIKFKIEAVDENCRQYIKPRYTQNEYLTELEEARKEIALLKRKIKHLEG